MVAQPEQVLIVESDETHRKALAQELQKLGYNPAEADSGRNALDMLSSSQRFDLLFLSTGLWGMNSYQVLDRIKSSGMLQSMPVIMLTPSNNLLGIERYMELGAADFLLEPVNSVLLKIRVESCLATKKLREQEKDTTREELLKIERDVQIARQIQLGFLPDTLPQPDGWEIAAAFHPAREVAGDFYDAFMLTQNRRVGIVIADVCDKGVGAALFMSLSRSLIRAFAQQHYTVSSWTDILTDSGSSSPRKGGGRYTMPTIGAAALKNAMELTNNYITHNHAEMNMFVTLFFGVLDPTTGSLIYVNGGHVPPIIVNPSGEFKAELKMTGPAVGLLPDVEFKIGEAHIDPGDILFCATDGVTDARSPDRTFFGKEGMYGLLRQPVPSAHGLLSLFESHLQAHIANAVQFDDITMMAVRRIPEEEKV